MDLFDLYEIIGDNSVLLAFLQDKKLILTERECEKCEKLCKIVMVGEKFQFRCSKCGKYNASVLKNYFLYKSKLSYSEVLLVVYLFVKGVTVKQTCEMVNLNKNTIVDWFNFCRDICILDCATPSGKIGGMGKTVEVDESIFGIDSWVFGGIERGSNNCFLIPVERRDCETLLKVIKENIEKGTTIISDCWRGYKDLNKEQFNDLTVTHSVTFVDAITGAQTNTIKSTWGKVKSEIPNSGRYKEHFIGYLSSYIWFKKNGRDFEHFIDTIRKYYT